MPEREGKPPRLSARHGNVRGLRALKGVDRLHMSIRILAFPPTPPARLAPAVAVRYVPPAPEDAPPAPRAERVPVVCGVRLGWAVAPRVVGGGW